ncbi:hypothetical protein RchiOBHm_Chr5g0051491 [Rosa chinensis]|uniref:Uncharacterized protein n=1 Tax=Rosa chinensis TaxID=74649 RepID=A0A2P6QFD3_ROSCH|nr:hypothetical protein RchiOBHm_Chr5g0051491 [Rosa chinensis]
MLFACWLLASIKIADHFLSPLQQGFVSFLMYFLCPLLLPSSLFCPSLRCLSAASFYRRVMDEVELGMTLV